MACSNCDGCPLQGISTPAPIPKQTMARFVVVTDAPSPHNLSEGRLMNRQASTLFGKNMTAVGFSRDDFVFFPQVRCPHDVDQLTTKEVKSIRDHCRPYLTDYISTVEPEAILPLGNNAARQVFDKAVKITNVRGIAERSTELGTVVFPLLSPGMVLMYPQHLATFETDCKTLYELSQVSYNLRARAKSQLGKYEIITDLQFLIDMEPRVLFFDTENTGLSHFYKGVDDVRTYDPDIHDRKFDPSAAVLTMQFCVEPGTAYMLVWDHPEKPATSRAKRKLRKQLYELLNNPRTIVVGQNAKYDRVYVEANIGVRYPIGGDTLMMACLIDENSIAKGQDMLVRQYVPEMAGYADHFNATTDKSRMWEVPLPKLIDYGCGDVDSGLRLYRALRKIIYSDTKLKAHYKYVSIPGLNAFSLIEQRGMEVDEDALDAFEEVMDEEVTKQYESLISQVPRSIKRKHIQIVTEKKGKIADALKFSRADFTRDILFYHKDGFRLKPKVFTPKTAKLAPDKRIASTSSKDHLPYFFDDCPFTYELSEYVKNERLLSTNIRGFKKKYIVDGLVRPTYSLAKTVTGRTSSEDPNGQNIPKRGKMAKAYRRSFVAPEGYYVLEADLSQAELRISASMANEPTMLRIYREGGDIHKETALIVLGISKARFMELSKDEQKSARQKAKAVNFGFIYGMGWRKFIGYAKTQYGVEFTDEEAQRIRNAFFAKYSKLTAWHERQRKEAERTGQVRSYSGRIRHLPMIYSDDEMIQQEAGRQSINSPVQEFASSLGVMAIGRLVKEIDPKYLAPIAFVHDAIFCYVKAEYLEWGAKTLKWYMETNPLREWFGVKLPCPIVADVSFGLNFGDTYELEGLTLDEPYDFTPVVTNDEGEEVIFVPEQVEPPNYGFLPEFLAELDK